MPKESRTPHLVTRCIELTELSERALSVALGKSPETLKSQRRRQHLQPDVAVALAELLNDDTTDWALQALIDRHEVSAPPVV